MAAGVEGKFFSSFLYFVTKGGAVRDIPKDGCEGD